MPSGLLQREMNWIDTGQFTVKRCGFGYDCNGETDSDATGETGGDTYSETGARSGERGGESTGGNIDWNYGWINGTRFTAAEACSLFRSFRNCLRRPGKSSYA